MSSSTPHITASASPLATDITNVYRRGNTKDPMAKRFSPSYATGSFSFPPITCYKKKALAIVTSSSVARPMQTAMSRALMYFASGLVARWGSVR